MNIGERVIELRRAKRMTQAELAKGADLSREYVVRIEAGLHDPSLSKAARLASALGVSIDELMKPAKKPRGPTAGRWRVRPMTDVQRPFEEALATRFRAAQKLGSTFVDVVSGELHREVGGYPGPDHRMPVCCSVMEREMRSDDRIIRTPPKGRGATLTIRYRLPREGRA
jgi:transcriptional regulator with XRE-family HTH domain